MGQLVEDILATLLGLRGPVVYLIVGALSWAEAAFFLGLVTPGELAMAGGGVLASRGQVALAGVAAAAAIGTAVGNSTGFWLGRAWGTRLLEWRPLRKLLGGSIDAARSFFARRGRWAVVLGRFASYLRIFVPFLAGAAGMPYRRFALLDLPAGTVWAVGWVVVGFALGESWEVLLDAAGPAAFLVLILFALAVLIRWMAVRIARRREPIEAMARRAFAARVAVWFRARARALAAWLGRRLDPRLARGLNLTLGFLAILLGVGGVGLVLDQTQAVRGLALVDFPVLEWMSATRTEAAVRVARTGLWLFQWPGLILPALLTAAGLGWRLGWRAGARAALGILGSGVGAYLFDRLVLEGVVPRAQFPAVAVAVGASILVHATAAAGDRLAWGRTVATAALGLFLACAIALGTIVAGWAAPSGIALGFALGLGWSAAVEMQARVL